jgi:uncharacterized protein YqfB (UPF0267 family)
MVIGFKQQFVAPILAGTKIHTIREDKGNRWKAGMLIQMATGVRTKDYKCFNMSQCLCTQDIEISYFEEIDPGEGELYEVRIDGKLLNIAEVIQLSRNDGFESVLDFLKWFSNDFTGKIIHWTDLKY